jgi:hypothetical protein
MKNLLLLSFALMMSVSLGFAQGIDFPPDPPDDNGPDGIPLDGGASLLLAAGGAYAFKRLKEGKTKKVTLKA